MPQRASPSIKMATVTQPFLSLIFFPQETSILCVVSALDVIMTYHLLNRSDIGFTESNPFARYFLDRWGMEGMAYFKAAMTAIVCVLTQIVARKNPQLAKQVLGLATVIIAWVVIYSVWLHFHHQQIVESPEVEAIISCITDTLV